MAWVKLSVMVNARVEASSEEEAKATLREVLKQTSQAYDGVSIRYDDLSYVPPTFKDEDDDDEQARKANDAS